MGHCPERSQPLSADPTLHALSPHELSLLISLLKIGSIEVGFKFVWCRVVR